MSALLQIVSHEYRKYVFTRGFLLFLAIIPLTGVLGILAGVVSQRAAPVRHFVVIDQAGGYGAVIDEAVAIRRSWDEIWHWDTQLERLWPDAAGEESPLSYPFKPGPKTPERRADFAAAGGIEAAQEEARRVLPEGAPLPGPVRDRFIRVPLPPEAERLGTPEDVIAALSPYLVDEQNLPGRNAPLFAVVVIPEGIDTGTSVQFWSKNLVDGDLRGFIEETLTDHLRRSAYLAEGIEADRLAEIGRLAVDVAPYKAAGEVEEESGPAGANEVVGTVLPLILAYALLIMTTSIGGMLLTSTIEEKSNKIVEVLLSSVSAGTLMFGKLIGLMMVGLTIPVLFLSAGFVALQFLSDGALGVALQGALFSSPLIPLFFFYFIMGYLFFASIYLAVGAMSNTIQDAQTFVGPLTLLLFLPAPFLQLIVADPNGLIARIFTWIPLYTPYAVMMRISATPPRWELIGATSLFVVIVLYVVLTMGKIYRAGVLSSGGAPSFRQVRELVRQRA